MTTETHSCTAQWCSDLRVGYLARLLVHERQRLEGYAGKRPGALGKLMERAGRLDEEILERQACLDHLPPSVLHGIEDALQGLRSRRRPMHSRALLDPKTGQLPQLDRLVRGAWPSIRKPLLVSHYMLKTALRLETVLALARVLKPSEPTSTATPQGEQALLVLCNQAGSTRDRLAAIETLCTELGNNWFWPTARNTLLHYTFAWPLLVTEQSEQHPNEKPLAFTFPVAVDLVFDGRSETRLLAADRPGEAPIPLGENDPWEGWRPQLEQAAELSRSLYRSRWQGWPEPLAEGDFFTNAWNASVVYDLTWARAVTDGLTPTQPRHSSAVGYFAQVVLARLLGRAPYLPSAVSGVLEKKALKPESNFGRASSAEVKLELALESQFFERIVLGDAGSAEWDASKLPEEADDSPTEVYYAASIEELCDLVQYDGWQPRARVRLPEFEAARQRRAHGEQEDPTRPIRREVPPLQTFQQVLAAFGVAPNQAGESVARSQQAMAPSQVDLLLSQLEQQRPDLAWTFFRLDPEEGAVSFCHSLWRAIDAAPADLSDLLASTGDPLAIGRKFGRLLSLFTPQSEQAPAFRAPDLIVLFGAHDRCPESVRAVLRCLREEHLLPPSPLSEGACVRVILLEETPEPGATLRCEEPPGPEDIVLSWLSVFRWGVLRYPAELYVRWCARYFGKHAGDMLALLREGVRRGAVLHGRLLASPEAYFLVPAASLFATRAFEKLTLEQQAACRLTAALVLSPLGLGAPLPRMDYERCTLPELLHEADWQLHRAAELAPHGSHLAHHVALAAEHLRALRQEDMAALEALESFPLEQHFAEEDLHPERPRKQSEEPIVRRGENGWEFLPIRPLGDGGFGTVLLADAKLGAKHERVALKIYHHAQNEAEEAMHRELSAMQAIESLRTPRVVDWGSRDEGREWFIAIERSQSGNLATNLSLGDRHRPLPVEQAIVLLRDISQALVHAHRAGLLHLDVKPANVLLVEGGTRYWLSDFGLARATGYDNGEEKIGGTRGYSAPEQRVLPDPTQLDARADLYGAGRTILAALVGAPEGDAPFAIPDDLPQWLRRLLAAMTRQDRRERPGSAAEVLLAIDRRRYPVLPPAPGTPVVPEEGPQLWRRLHDPVWRRILKDGFSPEGAGTGYRLSLEAIRTVGAGVPLMTQEEQSFHVLVLLRGAVSIYVNGKKMAEERREGSIFGEVSALTGMPRTADVITLRPATVLYFQPCDFEEFLREQSVLAPRLLRLVAERLARN